MWDLMKTIEKTPTRLCKLSLITAKRKLRLYKRDFSFAYDFAKNPVKFDFEFTFDDTDIP